MDVLVKHRNHFGYILIISYKSIKVKYFFVHTKKINFFCNKVLAKLKKMYII